MSVPVVFLIVTLSRLGAGAGVELPPGADVELPPGDGAEPPPETGAGVLPAPWMGVEVEPVVEALAPLNPPASYRYRSPRSCFSTAMADRAECGR